MNAKEFLRSKGVTSTGKMFTVALIELWLEEFANLKQTNITPTTETIFTDYDFGKIIGRTRALLDNNISFEKLMIPAPIQEKIFALLDSYEVHWEIAHTYTNFIDIKINYTKPHQRSL